MDYLIISPSGLGLFMVPSLGRRNEVKKIYFSILDSKLKTVGMNMELFPRWNKLEMNFNPFSILNSHSKDDLIVVADDVGTGALNDMLRKQGFKVIGGSEFTDKLEDDRDYATELFSRVMDVPETEKFTSFSDGIKRLKSAKKEDRYVFKPHDGMVPKDMTYVSKDVQDMIQTMETFKSEWKWEEEFQLQKYVEGILVDFGAWFNGKEWLENSHYLYFENKPFLSGDKGPATGGEIALVIYRENKGIFYDILEKLKPVFAKTGYVGQISVNSIVSEDDKKPYFLELTPRFGYPSFPQDITAIEENEKYLHDLFTALAYQKHQNLFTQKPVVVINVSTPPYPNKFGVKSVKGLPVKWADEWHQYFYPYFVQYDEKKKSIVLTGDDAITLNVTCCDNTVDGAISMIYETYIPTVHLKNMQYRNDLGDDAKKRLKKLHDWKLI